VARFPQEKLDNHLRSLVQDSGLTVVVAEEFRILRPAGTSFQIERRVVRAITPASLSKQDYVGTYKNNFILAVAPSDDSACPIGIAWIDVSTGDFFTSLTTAECLADEIYRVSPGEVVLDSAMRDDGHHFAWASFKLRHPQFAISYAAADVLPGMSAERRALSLISAHASEKLLGSPQLPSPFKRSSESTMAIDAHTLRALEIRAPAHSEGTPEGSLLAAVDRTSTIGGRRLLLSRLCEVSRSRIPKASWSPV
jgi:DNA mismatch repair ATPase MutS